MWMAHQRLGFFGFDVVRDVERRRFEAVVDVAYAVSAVGDVLDAWWAMSAWPEAQPFSGGVLDAWPKRVSDGLAVCRREWEAVMSYARWRATPRKAARRG